VRVGRLNDFKSSPTRDEPDIKSETLYVADGPLADIKLLLT